MSYKSLSLINAENFLDNHLSGVEFSSEAVDNLDPSTGENAQLEFISAVNSSHKRLAKGLFGKSDRFEQFEQDITKALGALKPKISPLALFDHGFWLFVASETIDAIRWRYPDTSAKDLRVNAGFKRAAFAESLYGRLLIRHGIVESATDLADFFGQDFWRSHIFRTNWGRNSDIAVAFAREVLEKDFKVKDQREIAKAIKRKNSNLLLETFDHESAVAIVSEAVSEVGLR